MLSGAASRAIKGTEYEARLKNGFDDNQYNRLVNDNDEDLRRGKCRPLETDRLKWGTSENILTHQLCVAETLVLNGAAVWNPDFDHTKPEDEMIKVTHPQLVISFDESEASLDGTDDSLTALRLAPGSSRNPTDLKGQPIPDDGEVIATKTSCGGSICAGSNGAGAALPMLYCFAGESYAPEWTDAAGTCPPPLSGIADEHGNLMPAQFVCSKKGGVNNDIGLYYAKHIILPVLANAAGAGQEFTVSPEPAWRHEDHWAKRSDWFAGEIAKGTHRKRRGTALCDGYGAHMTAPVLRELREPSNPAHPAVDLCLRTPHMSHRQQNEDIENFPVLKPAWRKAKAAKIASNMLGIDVIAFDAFRQAYVRRPNGLKSRKLGLDQVDLMACLKGPFEKAFAIDINVKGWKKAGLIPFTSRVYWELRGMEEARERADKLKRQKSSDFKPIDYSQLSVTGAVTGGSDASSDASPVAGAAAAGSDSPPGTAVEVVGAAAGAGAGPQKKRKVKMGSGKISLRNKPATADAAYAEVAEDEKRREKEEAEKVAKRAEKEQAKKEDLAKKVALGVDLLRSEKWEEAKTKASNTASQVDPAKFQQEVNRTFKDDEIRAIIISRMEQPAKGKKADRLAQLMELLQAAPAPLMLTNHA